MKYIGKPDFFYIKRLCKPLVFTTLLFVCFMLCVLEVASLGMIRGGDMAHDMWQFFESVYAEE